VTLAAGALAAGLAGEAADAAVPGILVRTAVRGAALAAAGKGLAGVVSTEVVALTEGVVRAMLLTKVKVVGAVVLGLALLGGGGGVLTYRTVAGEPGAGPQDAARTAQGGRAAPADEEKLKAMLAQKDKEIRDLRDRMAALQDELQQTVRRLEQTVAAQQEQAERAREAERNARRAADAERLARQSAEVAAARAARESQQRGGGTAAGARAGEPPPVAGVSAGQVEQARDDVELLEAQLEAKRAQQRATELSLQAANDIAQHMGADAKARMELAALTGQVQVKAADVKEAVVRLNQAKRRLAKLQGPAEPAHDSQHQQLGQRAAELEKRLDALKKELDGLRRELQPQRPGRP
jgi:DNA repair exonuclease SbcCD ATPase subunit